MFNSGGKLARIEDANGNSITLTYDGDNLLVTAADSAGDSLSFTYENGRIATVTDHAGRVTTYEYGAEGTQLTQVTYSDGTSTGYAYHEETGAITDHALSSITFRDGTRRHFEYDSYGRLTAQYRDGEFGRISYAFDPTGPTTVTDATGGWTKLWPDENGNVIISEDALGSRTLFRHDSALNLIGVTEPMGGEYALEYDAGNRLIAMQNPLEDWVRLTYEEAFGVVDSVTDERGQLTEHDRDANGELVRNAYPDGSNETFTRGSDGLVTAVTTRRGDTIGLEYDAHGRVTRKTYPDGAFVTYAYDGVGRLTHVTDSTGAIILTYDERDLLVGISYPSGHWFAFEYNDMGRRTRRTGDDGFVLNYEYDAIGVLTRIYDGSGAEYIRYDYDEAGHVASEYKGNGTYALYTYDLAGQMLSLVNHGADDSVLSSFAYTYDANGRRTSMTTAEGVTGYAYDVLGRLTAVSFPDGGSISYAYDEAGNRVEVTRDSTPAAYDANIMNQYVSAGAATFTYDANGSMAGRSDGGSNTQYEYDYENRLVRVDTPEGDTWQFEYDALGYRTAVTHNGAVTRYVVDPTGLGDVSAEYDAAGALIARYVHGFGLAGRVAADGAALYYAFDASGTRGNSPTRPRRLFRATTTRLSESSGPRAGPRITTSPSRGARGLWPRQAGNSTTCGPATMRRRLGGSSRPTPWAWRTAPICTPTLSTTPSDSRTRRAPSARSRVVARGPRMRPGRWRMGSGTPETTDSGIAFSRRDGPARYRAP